MRQNFKHKKQGDLLRVGHVNKLSDHARKFERASFSGLNMFHSGSVFNVASPNPTHLYTAVISDNKISATCPEDAGLYLIKMLFFQHDKGRWVIESNKPWPMDERGVNFGEVPTYSVDDIVTVYWDAQRRMFIPAKASPPGTYVEIEYIDDPARGFLMSSYGVCLGRMVTFKPAEDWNTQYTSPTILTYGANVFVGFVDQSRGGAPGQRYLSQSCGSKTCGDLTYPLVMVDGGGEVAGSLAEDHPGCNTEFDIWLYPTWLVGTRKWDISDCDDDNLKYKAIDYRLGVPEPSKYASGLFAPRLSTTHGMIFEAIDIDCTSPEECVLCEASS
jgi:hypothetical protein